MSLKSIPKEQEGISQQTLSFLVSAGYWTIQVVNKWHVPERDKYNTRETSQCVKKETKSYLKAQKMSPITRKGSQHSYMVQEQGDGKSVWYLCPWTEDIQPASQDCTGKALDSLEYRNTGWRPILKEGKVIKMRKCKANWGVVFLNHLPFANPTNYHLILDDLLLPCKLQSPWVGQDDGAASPFSFFFPYGSVALSVCLLQTTESSLWVSMGAACPSTVTVPF